MIKSYKLRRRLSNAFIYILLAVLGIIWVSPLIWMVLHSFRAEGGSAVHYLLPKSFTVQHYVDLFTDTALLNFSRWFLNTFIVAIFYCIISTFSVLMVSYTFSRLRFKARKPLINIGMILGMFPGFMTMIAIYYLLKAMGLTQTLPALAIQQVQVLVSRLVRASLTQSQERLMKLLLLTVLQRIRFSGRLFFQCQSQFWFTQF